MGSPAADRCLVSPKVCIRKEAIPGSLSSLPKIVTEEGATKVVCHKRKGEIPSKCPSITKDTPR